MIYSVEKMKAVMLERVASIVHDEDVTKPKSVDSGSDKSGGSSKRRWVVLSSSYKMQILL